MMQGVKPDIIRVAQLRQTNNNRVQHKQEEYTLFRQARDKRQGIIMYNVLSLKKNPPRKYDKMDKFE